MRIGLITYDHPHLKTEQVYSRMRHHMDVVFYALPFVKRARRAVAFPHRPNQANAVHPRELAAKDGRLYIPVPDDLAIDDGCDLYLILAGKLLSAKCLEGKTVINTHPGLLPRTRGLDAMKWAILEGDPLGVTTHIIDADTDAGRILNRANTPVYPSDTLDTLARRHYELEIWVTAHRWGESWGAEYNETPGTVHKRMNIEDEQTMLSRWPAWRERYSA